MPMRRWILLPGRRARSLRSLVGVSVVAVLAACTTPGGTATPPTAAPTASASTSSPTATTTPTTTATTSTASDEQLAVQAVERYYAEFNKALQTRLTVDFRKTFKEGCPKCLQAANKIDGVVASGGRFEGGVITVSRLRATEVTDKIAGRKVLRGDVSSLPTRVLAARGAIVESDTGGSTERLFVLVRTGDAYLVWDVL